MIEQKVKETLEKFLDKNGRSLSSERLKASNGVSIVNQKPTKTSPEGRNKFNYGRNTIRLVAQEGDKVVELARLAQTPTGNTFQLVAVPGYEEKISEALPELEEALSS